MNLREEFLGYLQTHVKTSLRDVLKIAVIAKKRVKYTVVIFVDADSLPYADPNIRTKIIKRSSYDMTESSQVFSFTTPQK